MARAAAAPPGLHDLIQEQDCTSKRGAISFSTRLQVEMTAGHRCESLMRREDGKAKSIRGYDLEVGFSN